VSLILSLDISTSTGFAVLDNTEPTKPVAFGAIKLSKRAKDYASHPWGYYLAAKDLAKQLVAKVLEVRPDVVVVEETNSARSRFTQKYLEYCHFAFLFEFFEAFEGEEIKLVYLNTSDWRRTMDVRLTKEDKGQNAKLSRHKRKSADRGVKLDKKALGIRGRTTIKHVAIRRANEIFGTAFLAKDDDAADALLQALAFIRGCPPCTGKD